MKDGVYYAIATHYIPAEKNKREDAFEHTYYSGIKDHSMNTERIGSKNNMLWVCEYTLEKAYKSLATAKRALASRKKYNERETNDGYWFVNSYLIKIVISNDEVILYEMKES